jgi:hypothetical protein
MSLDKSISIWANSLVGFNPRLDALVTQASESVLLASLVVGCISIGWANKPHRPRIAAMIAGGLVSVALCRVLQNIIARPRPCLSLPLHLVGSSAWAAHWGSYPSDTLCVLGALAATAWWLSPRLGFPAVLAATVVAFARLALGFHFASDLLAGFALGATGAYAGGRLLTGAMSRVDWTHPLAVVLTAATAVQCATFLSGVQLGLKLLWGGITPN